MESFTSWVRGEPWDLRSKWLPGRDSNPDKQNQNLSCYRYTTGQDQGGGYLGHPRDHGKGKMFNKKGSPTWKSLLEIIGMGAYRSASGLTHFGPLRGSCVLKI